jgi:predicted nucleotidyltransferase
MKPFPLENFSPFEELLVGLAQANVDYAVVGGVAVSLNGFVRATDDVDLIVQDSPENIRRLLDYLSHWGEGWARELKVDDFLPQEGSIRVCEEFDVDLFTRMSGKKWEDFRPRFHFLEIEGVRIPYLAAEDLIFLKHNSVREKDQIDVIALRRILGEQAMKSTETI